MFKISEGVKEFGNSIVDNYKDWQQGEHEFANKKTRLNIWTASGISYMRITGQNKRFWTYREKKYIYNCILKAIRLQIEEKGYMDK